MKSNKTYYFGAGPASIPAPVLKEVQKDLFNVADTGLSILELGHRTPVFQSMMQDLEAKFRKFLAIPQHYQVIFMGSPVRIHFGLIPLHFLKSAAKAAYWVTGHWSKMAYEEALRLGEVQSLVMAQQPSAEAAYAYFTANETLTGFRFYPESVSCPLVADMTSCLLAEPIDVSNYAMIVAGAQKNLANAGMTVLIISDTWLKTIEAPDLPTYLDYRVYAKSHSLCVTPPTFNCYVMLKMLEWIEAKGGASFFYQMNQKKSQLLYDYLDNSEQYENTVPKAHRSCVNVTFTLKSPELTTDFIEGAKARGLLGLEGHRAVGGVRVSLYNAVPIEGVHRLIEYMEDFLG